MFPNFESLAQREQKRQELLERVQRHLRQTNAKRQMYEVASWASDATKGVSLSNTPSSSTQTDSSEDSKKCLSIENSQKKPEVSSIGINVKPITADTEVSAIPNTTDAEVSAIPMNMDAESQTDKVKTVPDDDQKEQIAARKWIKHLYKSNPNWSSLKLRPTKTNGSVDTKNYVGFRANLFNYETGRKLNSKYIDWVATMYSIRDIYSDGESNSIDEVSLMRMNDKGARPYANIKGKRSNRNRQGVDDIEDLSLSLKEARLSDIYFDKKSTSTSSDEEESKMKLFWTISKNKEFLVSNGLTKTITPMLGTTTKTYDVYNEGYVWVNGSTVIVYGKDSDRPRYAMTKRVNWGATLRLFIEMVKDRGLDIVIVGGEDLEMNIKPYKAADDALEAHHGVKTGLDEDMNEKLSIPDNDAKKILTEYYRQVQEGGVKIPFRLKPIVDTKTGPKPHTTYYFSEPMHDRVLNIRNKDHRAVSGDGWSNLMKTIRWADTFESLLDQMDIAYRSLNEIEGPKSDEEKKMEKIVNDNLRILRGIIFPNVSDIKYQSTEAYDHDEALQRLHDKARKRKNSVLQAARSAVKATKTVFSMKVKKYNEMVREKAAASERKMKRQGRGLRGAGVAPLEGVVRRGRTYNLNEIQGLATPSAYTYKQLGSKYIRIPDLDAETLVIVQPNRRKYGPKRGISDQLEAVIRTLAFKQQIDQAAYDKLSIDDKNCKEILAITHLQYNFHDRLEDPSESLRAEYDKLKGELELGNDNPSIIKQLKSLSVDMYSNRLISDSEFKDIIVRLI